MRFSQHTVGHAGFITIYGDTFVRLTPDQYRRRKHNLADVKMDGECYIAKVVDWIVFKIGEVFEIEGTLPKSYWALVTDPPQAAAVPAKVAAKVEGEETAAPAKAPAKPKGKLRGKK